MSRGGRFSAVLAALILGQIGLHACMAGVRMAVPLQALQAGQPAWRVGALLALFALAPVALALPAGRLADRQGYHRPVALAAALVVAGAGLAALSAALPALAGAAVLTGAGANIGLIAIQRTAGHMAGDSTERIRIFSWLGLAPALSNALGPVLAGLLIDTAGFRVAFAVLMLLPLAALAWSRRVPRERPPAAEPSAAGQPVGAARPRAWDLLRLPALRRLLLLNGLISACWDLHAFLLPLLGHERGFSASAIGLILGSFAVAVAAVRLLIPLWAHRLREGTVLAAAMAAIAGLFLVYPFVHAAAVMAGCAVLLGLALGSVQPMVMSMLHQVTPAGRHGEAIALRSMALNLSSTLMPLLFGAGGSAIGAGGLFWLMSALVGAGSLRARRL
ncbi:MFS transporter [Piscinibacter sakaiensis]|nr:MFS transporter [Piscinibacter sakaiensis]